MNSTLFVWITKFWKRQDKSCNMKLFAWRFLETYNNKQRRGKHRDKRTAAHEPDKVPSCDLLRYLQTSNYDQRNHSKHHKKQNKHPHLPWFKNLIRDITNILKPIFRVKNRSRNLGFLVCMQDEEDNVTKLESGSNAINSHKHEVSLGYVRWAIPKADQAV